PNMEPTAGVTDDVWESISKNEVVDVVRKALSRLPLRQRTVLILREIEGWSYSDIAPVVGTNVRGVEATLRRARARFRLEATNFETDENERAICRRVTHMAAADPSRFTQTELSHIERCDKCRLRTSRIRSADKIFGLMPALPLGGGGFSLRSAFDAFRSHRRTRSAGEGLKELLFKRDGVRSMIVSPFAQVVETAAALVVAAALAVSASPAQRSASAAAAQSPAITIVSPVFAQAPEVAFAEERQTNSASSSGFAAASSKQKGDGDVDLSSGILIEKVLPLDVVESGAASVIAINIDDVDSWEATDEIFTEVNEVATDLGVSSITSELDQVESLDAAAAGVSIDDLTSSAAFTEIAPRHLI
ncbi:MAG: RNA polymerase sigma factor, partial [Acidimicrobiia bacterium]